ncbi:MAG: fasciclin domain-containing protein [Salinivenus sp.]
MTFDTFLSAPPTRRWGAGLFAGLLAIALVLAGCDSNGTVEPEPAPGGPTTLADVVSSTDNLSTLATALDTTGRVGTLDDESATFTVFAPSNSAFSAYDVDFLINNADLLGGVLDYHVVAGQAVESDQLEDGQTLETVQGDQLEVSIDGDGNVFVEGAQVTNADVRTDNGVAHVVNDVLLTNRTAAERVQVTSATSTLNTALDAAGRAGTLNDENATFTIFAPPNAAFGPYDVDFLVNNADLLGEVLDYHVVSGSAVTSDQLSDGDTFTTVNGDQIEVSIDGDGNIFVEGTPVTTADIGASNAVIHLVGDVLLSNRTAGERMLATTETDALWQAITEAGLASAFNDANNNWTTFAPTNESLENADLSGFSQSEIQQILQYHTLDGVTTSADLLQLLSDNGGEVSVPTNQGEEVTITERDDGSIAFNNGQAVLNLDRVDQRASNGILHQIEGLLIPPSFTRSVSYDLEAQSNDGAIPGGVSGTVTFWEYTQNQTLVTLELDEGATGASVAHPAHIHNNSASEGGGISIYLTPIDGSGGGGTSARIVGRSFDELADFDGHVNIHESVANLGTIVAQGDVGANATGTLAAGLDLVDNRRSTRYTLEANGNGGSVAPNGIPGNVEFIELTSGITYVQTSLDPSPTGGATGASVSHPSHIHRTADGGIEYYLSPVDGTDPDARAGKLVGASYDDLTSFPGYVNVHESVANLQYIISQGNVGSTAP